MKLVFAELAWEDYLHWQQQDRKMVDRINKLKDMAVGVCLLFVVEMSVTDWTSMKRVLLTMILPLPWRPIAVARASPPSGRNVAMPEPPKPASSGPCAAWRATSIRC